MKKQYKKILSALVMLLLFGYILRSCTSGILQQKNMYWIARDSTWYPLDLRGREKKMIGFTSELMQAIADQEKFEYAFVNAYAKVILEGLEDERYDAAISSLTPSVMTRGSYNFSDPFYLFGPVLVVKSDSKAKNLSDMQGKLVGIESGFTQSENLENLPKDVLVIPYNHVSNALDSLFNNEIDGVIVDAIRGAVYTEGRFKDKLKVITKPFSENGLRILTLNTEEGRQFTTRFNQGLKKVIEDKTYFRLVEKWDVISPEDTAEE
jgi:polar amino acid transport system substrate-binding protein